MSRKITVQRPRSSSKPNNINAKMPEEYIVQNLPIKPKIVSGIKIEDKLMNNQIATKKRLESLKKNLEEEELREIRSKPKISERSRILAEKAEKRLLQQYNDIKEIPQTQDTNKIYTQVQPDVFLPTKVINKAPSHAKIDTKSPRTPASVPNSKKKTKSLLELSVLERNKIWLAEKQNKIGMKKRIKEEKDLVECTFSPVTSKTRLNKSVRDNESYNISFITNPQSDNFIEYPEQQPKGNLQKFPVYKPLAPFQVSISFKCGIDLKSFLKRAK
jgi:hypothetical protein